MRKSDIQELAVKLIRTDEALNIAQNDVKNGCWYAISMHPIWAWLITHGHCDIDNRKWATLWRGRTLIHANGSMQMRDYEDAFKFAVSIDVKLAMLIPSFVECQKLKGHILGSVELVEVCPKPTASYIGSPWHCEGFFGLKMAHQRAYKTPVAQRGNVGIFKIDEVLNPIVKELEA